MGGAAARRGVGKYAAGRRVKAATPNPAASAYGV